MTSYVGMCTLKGSEEEGNTKTQNDNKTIYCYIMAYALYCAFIRRVGSRSMWFAIFCNYITPEEGVWTIVAL